MENMDTVDKLAPRYGTGWTHYHYNCGVDVSGEPFEFCISCLKIKCANKKKQRFSDKNCFRLICSVLQEQAWATTA
jgi:hypothetical protein